MRFPLLCLLALLTHLGAETLPPLKDGQVPQNLEALWGDFDPTKEPLVAEVTKEWEQDGIVCRVVRYHIGVFKGKPATMAAFYAFPKGAKALPGLMHIHGGGQSASLATVVTDAKRGYASLSLNWGGNKMSFADGKVYDGLNTDWGALDATHPPQRNKVNHFAGGTKPDAFTLDPVESPRNDNWFLVTLAARRGLTFLESQPEVDPDRLGVYGHSMGGRLTTQLTGIDQRVKAAVPSCGGSGDLTAGSFEMPGGTRSKATPLELATTSENPYITRLRVPVLWLSPTNDFHANMDNMAWNWRNVPDPLLRLSVSPHFNHRHEDASALTQHLWFETHLKGMKGLIPQPAPEIEVKVGRRLPSETKLPHRQLPVTPSETEPSYGLEITVFLPTNLPATKVRLFWSQDPHPLTRFWRHIDLDAPSADLLKRPGGDRIHCYLNSEVDPDRPLFAYAHVYFPNPARYRQIPTVPGVANSADYAFSSRMDWASASQLQAVRLAVTSVKNGRATREILTLRETVARNGPRQPQGLILRKSGDWADWYRLNWGNPELWSAHTRIVKEPEFSGPKGAKLSFEIKAREDSWLAVKFVSNEWGAFSAGQKAEYAAVKELKVKDGWATVEVDLADVRPIGATKQALSDWSTLTEIALTPGIPAELKTPEMKPAKGWTRGTEPAIRDLRWVGGDYQASQRTSVTLTEAERTKAFDDSIKSSLEQEKKDKASR